ncbi:MAG: DUF4360 domain-containing protein [bacterium]|nr:DUF4360 domain-containing protein [bacterium]
MKKFVLSLAIVMAAMPSFADDIRLGNPSYGGTGCPGGSASASLSPDQKSLSLLFDQYVVDAGGQTGRTTSRKTCNVAVPVHVPQGLSLSIFKVDYRGFNSLPTGAYSQFNVEYFFAGARGPDYRKTFYGNLSDSYLLSNTLSASSIVWSACGQDVILRSNSSMLVRTNSRRDEAFSTVDSADIRAGLRYHLQWRRC